MVQAIKSVKVMKNNIGVVFDIEDRFKDKLVEKAVSIKETQGIILEVCTQLPELKEDYGSYGGGGYGGRNSGYGGRNGGYGDRNSGYGGRSNGYGDRNGGEGFNRGNSSGRYGSEGSSMGGGNQW